MSDLPVMTRTRTSLLLLMGKPGAPMKGNERIRVQVGRELRMYMFWTQTLGEESRV